MEALRPTATLDNAMPGDYLSIPCIEHEKLEFAVLRRRRLRLVYRDTDGALREQTVLPTDVATRDGAEWLFFQDGDGIEHVVRLDMIVF